MCLFDKREVIVPSVGGHLYRIPLEHKSEVTVVRKPWGWEAILWDEDGTSVEIDSDLFSVIAVVRFIKQADKIVKDAYEPMLPLPEWKFAVQ